MTFQKEAEAKATKLRTNYLAMGPDLAFPEACLSILEDFESLWGQCKMESRCRHRQLIRRLLVDIAATAHATSIILGLDGQSKDDRDATHDE